MSVQYIGKPSSALLSLADQYRLTYQLTGSFFGFDDALNASGIESRLYTVLPQKGLVMRSLPQATTGDVVVVCRVQPTDMLLGTTVGQMADRADLSSLDFSLGSDALLGTNVELSKVEYLGLVGNGAPTTGTSPIPSDGTVRDNENAQAESNDLASQLIRAFQGLGLLIIVVGIAYLYLESQD
jgi:hypothetical protein